MRDELTHPANDAAADSLIALDADGDVMVFGMVHMTGGDRSKHRAFPTGNVHPDLRRRGLGTALMNWLEQPAIERVEAFGDEAHPPWRRPSGSP